MKRFLFAAAAFALLGVFAAAQDPPVRPVRPVTPNPFENGGRKLQVQPLQPGAAPVAITKAAATRIAQAEEEVETLEAQRDVKRAHVKAAEVGVKAAEVKFEHVGKGGVAIPQIEVDKARLEVEAAKAQLEIRVAETKELEVKIKFAKKRLEDAKNVPAARPLPAPKAVDPPPPGGGN